MKWLHEDGAEVTKKHGQCSSAWPLSRPDRIGHFRAIKAEAHRIGIDTGFGPARLWALVMQPRESGSGIPRNPTSCNWEGCCAQRTKDICIVSARVQTLQAVGSVAVSLSPCRDEPTAWLALDRLFYSRAEYVTIETSEMQILHMLRPVVSI